MGNTSMPGDSSGPISRVAPGVSYAVWLALAAVAVAALLLRIHGGLARDLWEDEIIAAAHALQPAWRLPVEVVRNDVHPFLYFLQLHLWSLFTDSDLGLRLNSLAWNLAAILSMYVAVSRLDGRPAGLLAASFFALSAPAVWMALDLRPYSWMYCLLIWAYFCSEQAARAEGPALRWQAGTVLLCIGLIYSHALGFLVVFLLGLHMLLQLVQAGPSRQRLLAWFVMFGICGLSALPTIAVALARDANLGPASVDVLGWATELVMPRGTSAVLQLAAAAIYVTVAGCGIALPATRRMAAVFLVLPLAISTILALGGATIFKPNIFSTAVNPFFCIVAARLALWLPGSLRWPATAGLALLLLAFSASFLADRPPTTGFKAASDLIVAEARPGDLVYAPQPSMFWGMLRYLGTDRRDWQLGVAPRLSPAWQRVYDRLGPGIVSAFGLMPETQTIETRAGLPLVVGNDSLDQLAGARRIWLVSYDRADLPPGYPPEVLEGRRRQRSIEIGFLQLSLYD